MQGATELPVPQIRGAELAAAPIDTTTWGGDNLARFRGNAAEVRRLTAVHQEKNYDTNRFFQTAREGAGVETNKQHKERINKYGAKKTEVETIATTAKASGDTLHEATAREAAQRVQDGIDVAQGIEVLDGLKGRDLQAMPDADVLNLADRVGIPLVDSTGKKRKLSVLKTDITAIQQRTFNYLRTSSIGSALTQEFQSMGHALLPGELDQILTHQIMRPEVREQMFTAMDEAVRAALSKGKSIDFGALDTMSENLRNLAPRAIVDLLEQDNNVFNTEFQAEVESMQDESLRRIYSQWSKNNGTERQSKGTVRTNLRRDAQSMLNYPGNDLGIRQIIARGLGDDFADFAETTSWEEYQQLDPLKRAQIDAIHSTQKDKIVGKLYQQIISNRTVFDKDGGVVRWGKLGFNNAQLEALSDRFGEVPKEFLQKSKEGRTLLRQFEKTGMPKWLKMLIFMSLGALLMGGVGGAVGGFGAGSGVLEGFTALGGAGLGSASMGTLGATAGGVAGNH